jgi:putative DNA methylase
MVRAIEADFPFEYLSEVAEIESWRKEVHRPIYHMHKWWARRLGSVFRAVILGASQPSGADIMRLMYEPVDLDGLVVFDPFMGSGTTIGEAHKLGCTAIGRDINPVAYRLVKTALSRISRRRLIQLFGQLQEMVAPELRRLYTSVDRTGASCDVLYYFWVKVLPCPACHNSVDLFSSYIFARHAYQARFPQVQVVCPNCDGIFAQTQSSGAATCPDCQFEFDPQTGPARGAQVICGHCGASFSMAKQALAQGRPPEHRLYAKLVLTHNGMKDYLRASLDDRIAYQAAGVELVRRNPPLPHVEILPGFNTQQVLNYGYRYWDDMFNQRQLLALSTLADGIRQLPACVERDTLMVLFSGVLEFNNMFASYKGEGTGAVRHMFAHHILKPERTPIEANLWGTSKSSGSFSTLFESRILRAVRYKEAPFETMVSRQNGQKAGHKVFNLSPSIAASIVDSFPPGGLTKEAVYLSCGSSTSTDLPAGSVDMVVTDPPFFDNVHYSELADFFYVWQRMYFGEPWASNDSTTRHAEEVQDGVVANFASKLSRVLHECHRVLKDDGLLVFSYHHSRQEGWSAVADAVLSSGFTFVQAQPVKSEMAGAMPKSQAKSPIDLDVLLVCRKAERDGRARCDSNQAFSNAKCNATGKIQRFNGLGRLLSLNDIRVVFLSQLLVELSPGRNRDAMLTSFNTLLLRSGEIITTMYGDQAQARVSLYQPAAQQLVLFEEKVIYDANANDSDR